MYLDRFARLASQDYERTELEAVERLWALRAVDDLWQNHLVQMEVLRTSVQSPKLRSLGSARTSSASTVRAFVSLGGNNSRRHGEKHLFLRGASAEPIVDFDSLGDEEAPQTQTEVGRRALAVSVQ